MTSLAAYGNLLSVLFPSLTALLIYILFLLEKFDVKMGWHIIVVSLVCVNAHVCVASLWWCGSGGGCDSDCHSGVAVRHPA